jgi:hypothetical protein
VGLLRLAAQRVAGDGFATPADAVRWLTAMQAQDPAGVITSVALRTTDGRRDLVVDALNDASIVKSWPMRGTLHLVAAEDLPWMLATLAPRIVAGVRARHAELGLTATDLEQARALAVEALAGGRSLSRSELMAIWDAGGQPTTGQRGYHLLGYLAQTGTLCFGPVQDGQQRIVLLPEWVRTPRTLDRDEALGELAVRYFRGHGPATVPDFTAWGKLVAADVRTGVAIARPHLETLDVNGVEHLLDPATPDRLVACRRQARGVFLLPGFDEFMLGYRDRSAVLPAEFAGQVAPGGNGVFRPTVVAGGAVVGTWRRDPRSHTVLAEGFRPLTAATERAIAQRARHLP